MSLRPRGERTWAMTAVDYEVGVELAERLGRYGALEAEPEHPDERLLPALLSPELVLVAPPEVASAAREALPEPEPFDAWLRRIRESHAGAAVEEVAPDWEYAARREGRLAGVLFAAACAAGAALPVLLLVLVR